MMAFVDIFDVQTWYSKWPECPFQSAEFVEMVRAAVIKIQANMRSHCRRYKNVCLAGDLRGRGRIKSLVLPEMQMRLRNPIHPDDELHDSLLGTYSTPLQTIIWKIDHLFTYLNHLSASPFKFHAKVVHIVSDNFPAKGVCPNLKEEDCQAFEEECIRRLQKGLPPIPKIDENLVS